MGKIVTLHPVEESESVMGDNITDSSVPKSTAQEISLDIPHVSLDSISDTRPEQ